MKYKHVQREEELKGKVGKDWFGQFDDTRILGNIDFCVSPKKQLNENEQESIVWAEAKTKVVDIFTMFAQLILTIGKERTFDRHLPPIYLAVFDFQKIAFVPYEIIQDLFYTNDFNWNTTPSNHETKEFAAIKSKISAFLSIESLEFDFEVNKVELEFFIRNSLLKSNRNSKIKIDKNNFVSVYLRWLVQIKPLIHFDWALAKKENILDSDFFLADIFVDDKGTNDSLDDTTIKEDLFVFYKDGHYEISNTNLNLLYNAKIEIKNRVSYEQFWKKYHRQPVLDFQEYIIQRRDLLIPQDIRERKGAFFTPSQWVEKSQYYLTQTLGDNWQDEYIIWDCAAGTGNLLTGLTNKYNIWASTLDKADVNVIHERINNGANLLSSQVFQFDFLNDDFSTLPGPLLNILENPEKSKNLVFLINPPYAEATSKSVITKKGQNKIGVSTDHSINDYYNEIIGNASNELFALFMARIYEHFPNSILAQFSTLKFINGSNFRKFKSFFKASYKKGFIVPANTFDNVKGSFPIGFTIWNLSIKEPITSITCDIYNQENTFEGVKGFYGDLPDSINKWIKMYQDNEGTQIGLMVSCAPDFQHNNQLAILSKKQERYCFKITKNNLLENCIYYTCRHAIQATWLNDRDQFLFPNDKYKFDLDFQGDCLTFALFNNNITSKLDINHWIPFTENEVSASGKFESNFMTDFIEGKMIDPQTKIFHSNQRARIHFTPESSEVFKAGKLLWIYYHKQIGSSPNASLYDIKLHFQGKNANGRMNPKSVDNTYNQLLGDLRRTLKVLSIRITPKIYEYGFLKD